MDWIIGCICQLELCFVMYMIFRIKWYVARCFFQNFFEGSVVNIHLNNWCEKLGWEVGERCKFVVVCLIVVL